MAATIVDPVEPAGERRAVAAPQSAHSEPVAPSPTVSVVICAYTLDRWDLLVAAVHSALQQRRPPLEVIVVIDHCPELARRAVAELRGAVVLASSGPRGLSGARNTGIARARGEVVAFLDDDARAAPSWLAELVAPYADPGVVAVGGRAIPAWPRTRPAWFPPEFDWVVGCSHPGLPPTGGTVRNLIGANMSFRRSVFGAVGDFEHGLGRVGRIPLGCEETELCLRATEHFGDDSIVYVPGATVWHTVSPDRVTWRYFRSRCTSEGRSKAAVTRLAGNTRALRTERRYTMRVLPRGVLRAVADGVASPGRLLAVPAIVVGLASTALGFLEGRRVRPADTDDPGADVRPPSTWPHVAAVILALGLWAASLPRIDLDGLNDYGLISVLPVTVVVALLVLTVSFGVLARRDHAPGWLLAAHLGVLVVVLHATTALTYETLRYAWAWKHVGVVDFITRNDNLDIASGTFLAYPGWPGFFSLNDTLVGSAGMASSLAYAAWSPLALNLAYLAPAAMIYRTISSDRRLCWTALWLFVLGNWVGQDYFSPQATALLLYLATVAVCIRWLGDPRSPRRTVTQRDDGVVVVRARPGVPSRRTAIVVAILLTLAIVSTHQLTPYMLVSALVAIGVSGSRRTSLLALVAAVLAVGWALVVGNDFVASSFEGIVDSLGRLFGNAEALQSMAPDPSPAQGTVVLVDRLLTGALCGLAVLGVLRRRTTRRADLPLLVLAVSPAPLLLANDYGGEMLLRVYLFGLVALAFFAAAAIVQPRAGRRVRGAALPTAVLGLLLVAFLFAHFGKERMHRFTPDEAAAVEWLYDTVPAGALVVAPTPNFPWGHRDYERFGYEWIVYATGDDRATALAEPATYLTRLFRADERTRSYVVLTRSQAAAIDMTGTLPRGYVDGLSEALAEASTFSVAYRNDDAVVFEYIGTERPR